MSINDQLSTINRFIIFLLPHTFFGFGHNVRAEGTFRKISDRKPKFDDA